jgi:ABC-type sugar transport system substrate-binding protein
VIVGMDANPQARDAIAAGGNFEASMAQDFEGIGAAAAAAVARLVAGRDDHGARDLRADAAHHLGQRGGVIAPIA